MPWGSSMAAKVVVDAARRHSAEVRERAHVPVEERHLIAALVEPREVAPRVHEAQHEHPPFAALAVDLHGDVEEVDLRLVGRPVDERDEHLGFLSALLAPVRPHRRHADLEALIAKLAVQARRRDGLLGRRALAPVFDQLVEPRADGIEYRPLPGGLLPEYRLRLGHVLANRVATHAELLCHDPLTLPFHENLVPNNVNAIHPEHPSSRRCKET
jgi:hypothetical protein